MRDRQVATFLETWSGFRRGVISSDKPFQCATLSEVLESDVGAKYFLSATACAGILRRAEKRGKELPAALQHTLEAVVASEQTPSAKEDCR